MPAVTDPPRRLKVFVQGQIVLPDWVGDLDTYCRWRLAEDALEQGEMAFLDTGIWVDLSREEFLTHNQVKAAFDYAVMRAVQPAALGRYVPDRMLFKNVFANLSTEPDGLFFKWDTMRAGRLKLVEKPGQGFMEREGTPDLVLEVVSKTSVDKDTILLRELYWKAEIAEYWLVDVRQRMLRFEILEHTPGGYVSTTPADGWIRSKVLGKSFRLQQKIDPLGHPQFFVEISDAH